MAWQPISPQGTTRWEPARQRWVQLPAYLRESARSDGTWPETIDGDPRAKLETTGMLTVRGGGLLPITVSLASVTDVIVSDNRLSLMGSDRMLGSVYGRNHAETARVAGWIRRRLKTPQPQQVNVSLQIQQRSDTAVELQRLTNLLETGVLRQSEFETLKARLLASGR